MTRRRRESLTEQLTEQVINVAEKKTERPKAIDTSLLIPSGITLLNCACSDDLTGAFVLGQIVTLPGGSVSGKTMEVLTMLAECCADKRFDDYILIYDDGEGALGIDIPYLFGNELARKMISPNGIIIDLEARLEAGQEDDPIPSEMIQDFKGTILRLCNESEKPFIYILDSLDSLTTAEELEKEYKRAIAAAKSAEAVKELAGSYKTEKAKHIEEALRMIRAKLKKTKSALFIIQQLRANIGRGFGEKETTTSGGMSPFYYSYHQIWMNKVKTHTKEVGKIKKKIGSRTKAEVTKNKLNGKMQEVEFDIYYDYGIDDVAANVDFLITCGH
jgi:RecA/RadA recombinase